MKKKRRQESSSIEVESKDQWCGNTVIQRGKFPTLEVFKSEACEFGLRSTQTLPPFTIVAEYTGEVITEEECLRRMGKYKVSDAFYFASLGKGLILDAGKMGSIARFANHHCAPNCALQKWSVDGEARVVLITLDKSIPALTELCYNYHYSDDGLQLKESQRQPCHCGADGCAGTIGGKVVIQVPTAAVKWIERAKSLLTLLVPVAPHPSLQAYLSAQGLPLSRREVLTISDNNSLRTPKKCSVDQLKNHFEIVNEYVRRKHRQRQC